MSTFFDQLDLNFCLLSIKFKTNSKRKNYFLAACMYHTGYKEVDIINQDCPYGGQIGIGNSNPLLEQILSVSKVFRLHAVLHDASGYVRRVYDVGPGYIYALGHSQKINSCFLGHLSGLAYCVFLKIVYPKIFRSINV